MTQPHANLWAEVETLPQPPELIIDEVDALYTKIPNVTLTVKTADCLPILFSHPSGLIGGIHAGRKSTELQIVSRLFTHLSQKGYSKDFWIAFGPAICNACYQIDPVLDVHYDLVKENRNQLIDVLGQDGFVLQNSGLCTSCLNDQFYSYRKEKTTLRLFSFICRKS
jgi:hypothetical protein